MIEEIISKNRSYRRFNESKKVDTEVIKGLINLARLSASAANLQPLRYVISNSLDKNEDIFNNIGWAGYLQEWKGPEEGERPAAYIVILYDKNISKNPMVDVGIAAQSILLGAAEKGLGGCMIANINKNKLREKLKLEDRYEIALVVALGEPKEKVVIEEVKSGDVKYWRDEQSVHHVPKLKLEEIILDSDK